MSSHGSRRGTIVQILLVASVLVAVGSVGYAIAAPEEGQSVTEFYLLTENESGDLVADNYPTEVQRGENRSLVVGIDNHEHERTTYTVVVELQRVASDASDTRIRDTRELHRFQTTLGHGESWRNQHTVTPRMTGERLRLHYRLYRGSTTPPLNRSAAYRELYLWLNVTEAR